MHDQADIDGGSQASPPAGPGPLGREPDPGSPRAARIAILTTIPVMLLIVSLQQWQAFSGPPPAEKPAEAAVTPPDVDQFTVTAKLMVRVIGQIDDPGSGSLILDELRALAVTDAEELRLATVAGELKGAEAAIERIDELRADWTGAQTNEPTSEPTGEPAGESTEEPSDEPANEPGDAPTEKPAEDPANKQALLLEDAEDFRRLYAEGADALDQATKTRLTDHHGWFAELALVHDAPEGDPAREEVMSGGFVLLAILLLVGAGLFFGFIGGSVLLVIGAVLFSSGRLGTRFRPPAPGGSVYVEMLPVFVVGFVILQILAAVIAEIGFAGSDHVALALQWLLLGVLAWPIVRGVPLGRAAADLGWRPGPGGVLKEVGLGLIAYIAAIPVYVVAALVTVAILVVYELVRTLVRGPQPAEPPSNPIIEMVSDAGPLGLILLFTLATVWAPVVEETIFRGAVYRFMRERSGWLLSGLLSALLFGIMHQYQLFMLLPVISLGLVFAAIREWRGSLIASVTAHAVHNGLVLATLLTVMHLAMN